MKKMSVRKYVNDEKLGVFRFDDTMEVAVWGGSLFVNGVHLGASVGTVPMPDKRDWSVWYVGTVDDGKAVLEIVVDPSGVMVYGLPGEMKKLEVTVQKVDVRVWRGSLIGVIEGTTDRLVLRVTLMS